MQPFDPQIVPPSSIRPLRRREYDQLVRLGVFEGERVELLYGRIVEMSPAGTGHSYALRRLNALITPTLGGRAQVQVQSPLAASDESEPEPDLAVIELGDFLDGHPSSAHLAVEVSDTSLTRDLDLKAGLYAEMGVPDYWVVDLVHRVVVVHRRPVEGRYAEVTTVDADGEVVVLAVPDVVVRVADILPPAAPPPP